jgi:5-methylcytosine-specific restriction endonuclease McrA
MPRTRWDVPHATVWRKQRPTLDHIRPRSKGGGDEPENLQLAHAVCNKRKGNQWADRQGTRMRTQRSAGFP